MEFTVGLIAAALWLLVIVAGAFVYSRSSPGRVNRSIRQFNASQRTLSSNDPIVVYSFSRGGSVARRMAQIRPEPSLAIAGSGATPSTITGSQMSPRNPFQRQKNKNSDRPVLTEEPESSGSYSFGNLGQAEVGSPGFSTPTPLGREVQRPQLKDDEKIHAPDLEEDQKGRDEVEQHDWYDGGEVLVQPDPDPVMGPSDREQAGSTTTQSDPEEAGPSMTQSDSKQADSSTRDSSPQAMPDSDLGDDIRALLGWINSEESTSQSVRESSEGDPVNDQDDAPAASSRLVLQRGVRKVGNIAYVLVDDEGRPLLD